jgi:hypothetical protein
LVPETFGVSASCVASTSGSTYSVCRLTIFTSEARGLAVVLAVLDFLLAIVTSR